MNEQVQKQREEAVLLLESIAETHAFDLVGYLRNPTSYNGFAESMVELIEQAGYAIVRSQRVHHERLHLDRDAKG